MLRELVSELRFINACGYMNDQGIDLYLSI